MGRPIGNRGHPAPGTEAGPLQRSKLCSSERGTPLDADNFRHREFPQALRRILFPDLRHTYTSLLIAHGTHPKYIQAQLGHALDSKRRSIAMATSCRGRGHGFCYFAPDFAETIRSRFGFHLAMC